MKNRNETLELIKIQNESLSKLGLILIKESSSAVFTNSETCQFLIALGMEINTFSSSLKKSLEQNQLDKASYNKMKKKSIVINCKPRTIEYYLNVDTMLADARPKLKRDMSTALYDYTIFVIRSFFRVFDLLFTFLSCSEKTMAQHADEKIQKKYDLLASNTNELREMMCSACFFNYSYQLQFFQLDSRAYPQKIKNFHNKLIHAVNAIDGLVTQLGNVNEITPATF